VVVDIPGVEFEPTPPRAKGGGGPDSECDGWSTPALTLRSASLRGDKHRYYGRPRQDFTCAAVHEATGTVVFTVADGLSGAESSEIGAADACRAAVQAILAQLDEGHLNFGAVATHAAGALEWRAAHLLQVPELPDLARVESLLATTLVAGVARPEPDGVAVSLFRIGDSCAWILDQAPARFHPLFASKTGSGHAVVSNAVTALPRIPQPVEEVSGTLVPGQVLLVGTDGFGDPLGDGDGQVGALFARHLAAPPAPLWLAHVLDFSRETFDDDRTLLALWPRTRQES
jgi:serine/threonine protein phosphatase PrpC